MFEAKCRVHHVLRTFPQSITRNQHKPFIFKIGFKTVLSYNHEVHYLMVLLYKHHFGQVWTGKNMFTNECQIVCFKSLTHVINFTFICKLMTSHCSFHFAETITKNVCLWFILSNF